MIKAWNLHDLTLRALVEVNMPFIGLCCLSTCFVLKAVVDFC